MVNWKGIVAGASVATVVAMLAVAGGDTRNAPLIDATAPVTDAPTTVAATVAPTSTVAPVVPDVPAEVGGQPPANQAVRGAVVQVTPTQPPPAEPKDTCPAGSLIRSVDTGGRRLVAFTFDDGPSPSNTRPIMDAFSSRGLTATFFVIGNNVRTYPSIMREIVDRGFSVANHTITHQYSPSVIAREIAPANRIIESYTGRPTVYFRSPGLTQGSVIQSTLASLGMCNVFTSVDLRDWVAPRRSSAQLCASFSATLHPGMIVLLHDGGNGRPTTQAVPCMLDVARSRGYQVVSLGELMRSGQPKFGFSAEFSPRIEDWVGMPAPIGTG